MEVFYYFILKLYYILHILFLINQQPISRKNFIEKELKKIKIISIVVFRNKKISLEYKKNPIKSSKFNS
jgi:hypothetical protein